MAGKGAQDGAQGLSDEFRVRLPLKASGKARPRLGAHGRVYTPRSTQLAEAEIALRVQMMRPPRFSGPVDMTLVFTFVKPKTSKNRYPSVKPDLDNLVKTVFDALNGILWIDDAQVTSLRTTKRYGSEPAIDIVCRQDGYVKTR